MKNDSANTVNLLIFLSCIMVVLGVMVRDLYTPSLPVITKSINNELLSSTILVACLIGISISQLIYGPLSDCYGRRKIVLFGLVFTLIGNILSCFVNNGLELWLLQILSGVGAGAGIVISRAILRDNLSGSSLIKAISYQSMASTIPPAIAPIIGAYTQTLFNWRANFAVLFAVTLIGFILIFFLLPETLQANNRSKFSIHVTLKNYSLLLDNHEFIKYSLLSALFFSTIVIYSLFSPFIFQNQLGLTIDQNGMIYVFTALGYFIGATITGYLAKRFSTNSILLAGIILILLSSGLNLTVYCLKYLHVYYFVFNMTLVFLSCGLVTPVISKQGIEPFPKMAGSASALLFSIRMLTPAIIGMILNLFSNKNFLSLSLYLLVTAIMCSILFRSLLRYNQIDTAIEMN